MPIDRRGCQGNAWDFQQSPSGYLSALGFEAEEDNVGVVLHREDSFVAGELVCQPLGALGSPVILQKEGAGLVGSLEPTEAIRFHDTSPEPGQPFLADPLLKFVLRCSAACRHDPGKESIHLDQVLQSLAAHESGEVIEGSDDLLGIEAKFSSNEVCS